jgi:hypothetical protein
MMRSTKLPRSPGWSSINSKGLSAGHNVAGLASQSVAHSQLHQLKCGATQIPGDLFDFLPDGKGLGTATKSLVTPSGAAERFP